jgi:hypothetical protein
MKKYWAALLVCIILVGCTVNTTPAMKGITSLTNITASSLETIRVLADNLKDEGAKAKINAKVDQELRKALELHKALIELLEEYGDIDYKEFVDQAFELYRKYEGLKK